MKYIRFLSKRLVGHFVGGMLSVLLIPSNAAAQQPDTEQMAQLTQQGLKAKEQIRQILLKTELDPITKQLLLEDLERIDSRVRQEMKELLDQGAGSPRSSRQEPQPTVNEPTQASRVAPELPSNGVAEATGKEAAAKPTQMPSSDKPQPQGKPPQLELSDPLAGATKITGKNAVVGTKTDFEYEIDGAVRKADEPAFGKNGSFDFKVEATLMKAGKKVKVRQVVDNAQSDWATLTVISKPPIPLIKTPVVEGSNELKIHASDGAEVKAKINNKEWPQKLAKGESGEFTIELFDDDEKTRPRLLKADQSVAVVQDVEGVRSDAAKATVEKASEFEWGRVRASFTSGVEFSKEREDFSKQNLFLKFLIDKRWTGKQTKKLAVHSFFDATLASIPKSNETSSSQVDSAFLTSRKAAIFQGGLYLPVTLSGWDFKDGRNTLFLAPIFKAGLQTITEENPVPDEDRLDVEQDDVFNMWAAGVRIGHFNFSDTRLGYPDLISYLDLTYGKFENFELGFPVLDELGNPRTVFETRGRWSFEGRLKLPQIPLYLGFNANVGKGPDDVRFFFGTRFDVGKLLKILQDAEKEKDQ